MQLLANKTLVVYVYFDFAIIIGMISSLHWKVETAKPIFILKTMTKALHNDDEYGSVALPLTKGYFQLSVSTVSVRKLVRNQQNEK